MLHVLHVAMSMEIAMNVHFDDKVAQPAWRHLNGSVDEAWDAENGEETVPKPQNQENLQESHILMAITHQTAQFWEGLCESRAIFQGTIFPHSFSLNHVDK